jgi:hypothetical protein
MAAGDDGLWIEFLASHREAAAVASVALGGAVLLYGLFSWILDGGVLAALALDGERRARGGGEVLRESAQRARRMLTLGLFGTLLRIIPLALGGLAYAIAHALISGRTYQPMLMTSMLSLAATALAWTSVSVAIDYARGLSLDDPKTRSWRLLAGGLKLLFQRRAATLQLVAFPIAAWLAVAVIYGLVASHISALPLLTLVRLFAVVARVAITTTTLTAAARVARA